jgi:hypothetical protein
MRVVSRVRNWFRRDRRQQRRLERLEKDALRGRVPQADPEFHAGQTPGGQGFGSYN